MAVNTLPTMRTCGNCQLPHVRIFFDCIVTDASVSVNEVVFSGVTLHSVGEGILNEIIMACPSDVGYR